MSALRLSVNRALCDVPIGTARELAARIRAQHEGLDRPLVAAACFIETCCDGVYTTPIPFTDQEEADLAATIDAWELEVGYHRLPTSISALRDALRAQAA